ncbi:hypothetical protein BLNAU_16006 [Blattamonas nauphoetae]|uniref:Uncharacterized protein n=1 Tax=Blattamonas nauphoetae TaxID=2049346 RepID=A0ABQ9X934_9EUKA|nr:hypothetical protein BLNAU_16006 [Blattamonas nauphoetae]
MTIMFIVGICVNHRKSVHTSRHYLIGFLVYLICGNAAFSLLYLDLFSISSLYYSGTIMEVLVGVQGDILNAALFPSGYQITGHRSALIFGSILLAVISATSFFFSFASLANMVSSFSYRFTSHLLTAVLIIISTLGIVVCALNNVSSHGLYFSSRGLLLLICFSILVLFSIVQHVLLCKSRPTHIHTCTFIVGIVLASIGLVIIIVLEATSHSSLKSLITPSFEAKCGDIFQLNEEEKADVINTADALCSAAFDHFAKANCENLIISSSSPILPASPLEACTEQALSRLTIDSLASNTLTHLRLSNAIFILAVLVMIPSLVFFFLSVHRPKPKDEPPPPSDGDSESMNSGNIPESVYTHSLLQFQSEYKSSARDRSAYPSKFIIRDMEDT